MYCRFARLEILPKCGIKIRLFKKILKSSGLRIDPCCKPAIIHKKIIKNFLTFHKNLFSENLNVSKN